MRCTGRACKNATAVIGSRQSLAHPPPQEAPTFDVTKVTGGILLASLVLIGGWAVLLRASIEAELEATAITEREFQDVRIGRDTKPRLIKRLGEPVNSNEIEAADVEGLPDSAFERDCTYWDGQANYQTTYQVCYRSDGRVDSKSRFGG